MGPAVGRLAVVRPFRQRRRLNRWRCFLYLVAKQINDWRETLTILRPKHLINRCSGRDKPVTGVPAIAAAIVGPRSVLAEALCASTGYVLESSTRAR